MHNIDKIGKLDIDKLPRSVQNRLNKINQLLNINLKDCSDCNNYKNQLEFILLNIDKPNMNFFNLISEIDVHLMSKHGQLLPSTNKSAAVLTSLYVLFLVYIISKSILISILISLFTYFVLIKIFLRDKQRLSSFRKRFNNKNILK